MIMEPFQRPSAATHLASQPEVERAPLPDVAVEKEAVENGSQEESCASQQPQPHGARTTKLVAALILFIGTGACGILLAFGITAAKAIRSSSSKYSQPRLPARLNWSGIDTSWRPCGSIKPLEK